jgi:hypothetical protein
MADLTLFGLDDKVLSEFETKIVKPYFKEDVSGAVEALMQKALVEQEIFSKHHVKAVEVSSQ